MYSIDKEETLNVEVWEAYHDQVKRYIDQGGEYFRMFLHPSSTEIEFEEVGYYHSRQNFAWEIDRIIDLCEESNTLIQLDLMYHSRSEEHTSELQSRPHLVCRLLLEKKKYRN